MSHREFARMGGSSLRCDSTSEMHAWEGIRVSQTCCLLVRWYSPRCWVDLHLVGIAPLITGISRVRVNLCLFEARGIQVTELHQPQRSLCGVCHARTIRVSFTITLYKPVKVDFHPANPYLFHTMRPLLNKDFRRLRWLLRQEPPKPVRGSSACSTLSLSCADLPHAQTIWYDKSRLSPKAE